MINRKYLGNKNTAINRLSFLGTKIKITMTILAVLSILSSNIFNNLVYAMELVEPKANLSRRAQPMLTDRENVLECFKTLPSLHENSTFDFKTSDFKSVSKIIFDDKGGFKKNILSITIPNHDPMYVALGLWRAYQEDEFSKVITEARPTIDFFLQLVFNPGIQYTKHKFSMNDFSLITKLSATNPYFSSANLFECQVFDMEKKDYRLLGNNEIKVFLKIPRLTTLILKKTNINISSQFVTHPSLKWLELAESQVNDAGIKLLCNNARITYLNISNNPEITETGIFYIAENMKNLKSLIVSRNKLTGNSALLLAMMPNLETLDLSYNELVDDSAANKICNYLYKNSPKISRIDLRKTSVTNRNYDEINATLGRNQEAREKESGGK